uniref:Uncharacterized protein n=1 Tax=Rhizochromulina marina TaxID=1034831 RepID=A0A7S2RRG1_9STRA|mmetsp:Transcript_1988/g.5834  ORF Transcript_1988/g.5834 Transcript_1988/m.5834 type:complete len:121 (+) Transcript_1988:58-420(+)
MTSVNELFPRARKLAYDLEQQLKEVETLRMPASDMELGLEALRFQIEQLRALAEKEVNRREEWRVKVQELDETRAWVANKLYRWRQQHDRAALEDAERRELLGRLHMPSGGVGALDEEVC